MAFCEQCGAKLTAGTKFCEECGAAVEMPSGEKNGNCEALDATERGPSARNSTFKGEEWPSKWRAAAQDCGRNDLGLIITRENALLKQIGENAHADYDELIDGYITSAKRRGISYYYLDLDGCPFYRGDGDVESVVAALHKLVAIARPKYLMILGNEEIVKTAVWNNPAYDPEGDSDRCVEGDFCYAVLDANSPAGGQSYDFDELLRVGRVCSCAGEGLVSFARYFENAARHAGRMGRVEAYGLSALVWQDESNAEFRTVSHKNVDVSPGVTKEMVAQRIPVEANLLFFNLHGSADTKYWYGQKGGSYPQAFEPDVLNGASASYFLGVEACYGARYLGGLPIDQSIVQTALRNGCLAFLGSSEIAYGSPHPKGTCADIVVGEYIRHIDAGCSAGDAFLRGLEQLVKNAGTSMDDTDAKTFMEFSLYGDPSVSMRSSQKGVFGKGFLGKGVSKGIRIPMPDVRRAVDLALAEVDAKIESLVDGYVAENVLSEIPAEDFFKSAAQQVFKVGQTGLNVKRYRYVEGAMSQIVKVYFDEKGGVTKAALSK